MLKAIRRVVTGHDARGRSIIVEDRPATGTEQTEWPGRGVSILWSTQVPADNAAPETEVKPILPGQQGVSVMICEFPPDSELAAMSEARRNRVMRPLVNQDSQSVSIDSPRDPRMHATETLDYIIVLAGEITLILDEGEVVLKQSDTLVQRGTAHAWANRGTVSAITMAVTVGATPLQRSNA